jgi:hypothetical protein
MNHKEKQEKKAGELDEQEKQQIMSFEDKPNVIST